LGAEWRKRKEWELDIIHSTIHGLGSEVRRILILIDGFGCVIFRLFLHILQRKIVDMQTAS
jgi:hypothetical protein